MPNLPIVFVNSPVQAMVSEWSGEWCFLPPHGKTCINDWCEAWKAGYSGNRSFGQMGVGLYKYQWEPYKMCTDSYLPHSFSRSDFSGIDPVYDPWEVEMSGEAVIYYFDGGLHFSFSPSAVSTSAVVRSKNTLSGEEPTEFYVRPHVDSHNLIMQIDWEKGGDSNVELGTHFFDVVAEASGEATYFNMGIFLTDNEASSYAYDSSGSVIFETSGVAHSEGTDGTLNVLVTNDGHISLEISGEASIVVGEGQWSGFHSDVCYLGMKFIGNKTSVGTGEIGFKEFRVFTECDRYDYEFCEQRPCSHYPCEYADSPNISIGETEVLSSSYEEYGASSGIPPYEWAIIGTEGQGGATLSSPFGTRVTVHFSSKACGTFILTVTDYCKRTDVLYLRVVDHGSWYLLGRYDCDTELISGGVRFPVPAPTRPCPSEYVSCPVPYELLTKPNSGPIGDAVGWSAQITLTYINDLKVETSYYLLTRCDCYDCWYSYGRKFPDHPRPTFVYWSECGGERASGEYIVPTGYQYVWDCFRFDCGPDYECHEVYTSQGPRLMTRGLVGQYQSYYKWICP